MDILDVVGNYDTTLVDLGSCDADNIGLITLLHALSEKITGSEEVPSEEYYMRVFCPWSSERKEVTNDMELVDLFRSVGSDVVSVGSDSEEVVEVDDAREDGGVDRVGNEHGVDDEMNEVHGALAVAIVEEEDVCVNLELMEGYQSKSDDEYFSESKDEKPKAKIARLMKGNPFKKMVGGHTEFKVGQTHDSVQKKKKKKKKKRALTILKKEHIVCFSHLRRYAFMVQQCNPGSAVYIALQQPKPTFHRGHMEEYFFRLLHSMQTVVCICEGETLLNWTWFLTTLRGFLKYPEDRLICFMSDRQKGVLGSLKTEWPKANIRYCARHIYANFRKTYSTKKLKDPIWEASRAYDRHVFKRVMADIGVVSVGAKAWLEEIEPKHWSSMIHPILDLSTWADINVQPVIPPPMKKKAGRSKLLRKREFGEKQKAARRGSVICAKCKQAGHNKRTCKGVETSRSNKRATTDASYSQPAQGGGTFASQPLTVVQTQQQSQVTMHLD
ncbi:hypothetical protein EZV62_022290 [Acer yangbiense]|uniref:MULE transposase domain-containing protein n=1 Tax=Acer yangbiense TaxID=1000413 RepID=A0A5C7H838_9ROSI|nr:hypothetical protein EZV62_022290 [Acer yangbiense]